jgi:phage terminase large subunit-like protein
MDMLKWAKCADPKLAVEDFHGHDSIEGLDLANKVDIAAKAKVFWRDVEIEKTDEKTGEIISTTERHYYAFLNYYLNEDAIQSGSNSQYSGWQIAGLLTETPGNETDYWRIGDDILEDIGIFNVRELAYDPHQAPALIQGLRKRKDWDETVIPVEMTQNVQTMSPAMKELEGAVAGGRFHFNGDPILTWMISNVVCHRNAKDEVYPRKERLENKIDGVVALLLAINRAMVMEASPNSLLDFI